MALDNAYTSVQAGRHTVLQVQLDDNSWHTLPNLRSPGSLGGEANLVSVEQFGSNTAIQISGQNEPTSFDCAFNFVGDSDHTALLTAGRDGTGTIHGATSSVDLSENASYRLVIRDGSADTSRNISLPFTGKPAGANVDASGALNDSPVLNVSFSVASSGTPASLDSL